MGSGSESGYTYFYLLERGNRVKGCGSVVFILLDITSGRYVSRGYA